MAEFAAPVVGEASKFSLSHLEREFRYLLYSRTNIHNLDLEVQILKAKKAVVIRRIEEATMNDEVIRETVKVWLKAVDEFLGKATKLNDKAASIDHWSKGWVRGSRFSTGRGSQKLIESVKRLLQHADAFGEKVADKRLVHELVSFDGVLTPNGDFKDFGSRVTTANQVIQALQDDKVSLLGIYGMAGVGKSTLISALATYVKKHKLFHEVVVVKLTQNPEIKVIQGDIADRLGLKLEDADTMETRADRLFTRLSQPQKTLILLDNVWQRVELSEVGIRQGLKNCKVVFTTRDTNVCNAMGSKSRIELKLLTLEESWDLFQEKAGDLEDSLALPSFARDLSNECQGLPLLIVALGKALYGKNQKVWERALGSIQDSTLIGNHFFTGMRQVFSVMKFSYDFLDSEEVKFCFLLCCLFPEGYHISMDQLFHYMMGEMMLRKASTLQAARSDLDFIVDKLISASLVLQAKSRCIMMHDIVRDVAIAIASENDEFIVKAGMKVVNWSDINMQLANCRRLSFMTTRGNQISWTLPTRIQAAQLVTLSFRGNEKVKKISKGFFEDMENLSTVDLSYTAIKVLPFSLVSHTNLCTLLLEGCFYLDDVYLSNNMQKLEILSLRYSEITSFVVSSKVTTLKLLDLSYTTKLKHIPQNVISRFLNLEELYMFESFRAWEPEPREKDASSFKGKGAAEEDEPDRLSARISERRKGGEDSIQLSEGDENVFSFTKGKEVDEESASLTNKEKGREDSVRLFEDGDGVSSSSKVKEVGKGSASLSKKEERREGSAWFSEGEENISSTVKEKEVGKEAVILSKKEESREDSARLSELTSLHHLTSLELHVGNLGCLFQDIPNWERLRQFKIAVGVIEDFCPFGIDDGTQMEKSMYIELRSNVVAHWVKVLLGKTNFLLLKGAQNLIDLLQLGPGQEQQLFRELQVLILSDIQSGSSLIPCELLVRLKNLRKLVIMNCVYLEILIQLEDQAVLAGASSSSRFDMVKFSSIHASSVFPNLIYLRVCVCAELRYLFPMRIIRCLSQLQMLYISNCLRMEIVIGNENVEDVGKPDDERDIFPKLRVLSLEGLPCLSLFIQQDVHLELPVLEELTVKDCGGLKKLPFGPGSVPQLTKLVVVDDDDGWFNELMCDQNVKQRLLRLRNSLQLKGCRSLKDVELHDQWHPTLRSVRVIDYEGTTLTPCSFLKKMSHLKNLVIKNSEKLEMIDFGEEDSTMEEEVHSAGPSSSSANTSKFSKLTPYPAFGNLNCLRVSGCSAMKYLCPWRVIRGLVQLEKLYIDDCSEMEIVIKHEDEDQMILPNLRILSLHSLRKLSCVVLKSCRLELPALEELKVKGCENLDSEFLYKLLPQFRCVLQWDYRNFENQFENRFYVKRCRSLEVIELDDSWNPSLVKSLKVEHYEGATLVHHGLLRRPWNLEQLEVVLCPNLEAIIEFGDTAMIASSSSSEKDMLSASLCVFSNLTSFKVFCCDNLRYVLPVAVVRNMVQLKTLYVDRCNSMETIIEYENVEDGGDTQKDKGLLPKLEKLNLWDLPQLSSFAGQDILFDWPSLTRIEVWNCLGLKKLPLGGGSVPKLKYCTLDPKEWSDELIWEDEQLKSRLHSLL